MKALTLKRAVYIVYAGDFKTWNIIDCETQQVIGWGTVSEADQFLADHRTTYFEQTNIIH